MIAYEFGIDFVIKAILKKIVKSAVLIILYTNLNFFTIV